MSLDVTRNDQVKKTKMVLWALEEPHNLKVLPNKVKMGLPSLKTKHDKDLDKS